MLSALISLKSLNKYPTNRTLSLCLKVTIESDLNDGFALARGHGQRPLHGWENSHPPGACACPWCFCLGGLKRQFEGKLPALRALNLRIYFQCNRRPSGTHGVPQSENSPKLVCVDSNESVDEFVKDFCEQRPLAMFADRKIWSVNVTFRTETLKHDIGSGISQGECWCNERAINKESLADLARKIELRLLNGNATGSMAL